ncbi:outer membrane lipoprotein-sorting protein [Bdellovibrio svalbardensis]|uniref:Outer membrane lipoprotein-sorting protein n=1 Tax=Bdellovibrio svalbardensis TaxID=2972972 RepID=A0ABT6DLD2_9BACT|nr:outer membrane lipoprotein-sorting protein [Bdellovibrio svalbardensis]MDG0816616.1 outer membrane lipoprotein-sorting protein [Bdellovibrio svalbardensis]
MKRLPHQLSIKTVAISSLVLVILLTILSLFALPKLQTQYSLKQFLPKDNLLLKEDEKVRQAFQLSEAQPFVITAQIQDASSDWFETTKIESLQRLTDLLANYPGVKGTLSLATVQGAINSDAGLSVGPLLKSLPVEKWRSESLSNPLISPTLISKDGKTASVIINIKVLNTHEMTALRQNLEVTAAAAVPFAHIQIGGTPAVQTDVGVLLQTEIRNFVVLGFVACFVVLALIFGNWSPLIISFIIIVCANILVLAIMALAGYPFSILSSTIPILTTVDVVSLCIHTLLRYTEEKKHQPHLTHEQLSLNTLKAIIKPNLIASTTTMIGFLSLLTTNVPLIRDYGWTAALSIAVGWIVTTVLLLPLMLYLPGSQAREWAWSKARWGLYLFRRSGLWTVGIVIICLGLALKGQSLSWSARLFDDLPQNHQVRLSTETIDKELGGMIPVDIEVKGPQEAWNDPKLVNSLDGLLADIRQTPGVGSVVGLPDLIAAANLHHSRLPASRNSTAEIFFLYSLSNESPLKNFLSADSSSTRISIRTQDLPGNELHQLVQNLRSKTEKSFPDMNVKVTGMGSTIHHLNNDLSHELIFGFWQSMAAIVIVLMFVFKSLRWALVACIPNLVPPATLLGFLAVSETPIKPSVAIIFSIALGLAFNNTVYLLERLRTLQKNTKSRHLNIEKALWLEGNPCLISSLTLLSGFSVFMASYFAMNRIFGFYMLLSMLAGLVGDLILLPTMLKSCPWLLTPVKWKKEKIMAITSSLILAFLIFSAPKFAQAQPPTPEEIGKEMNTRIKTRDEEFTAQMKIIEADGSSKDREMKIWRLSPSKKEHSLMVRMLKPADLKGTTLLATLKDNKEDKWIYLPSTKQTRRLTGESSKGGILGSELSAEDFDFNRDQSANTTMQKELDIKGRKYFVLSSDVNNSSANYSKVVSFIAASEFLPIKAECYDKQGKLLKILEFNEYKKISGNKWRAEKIKIRNVQNKRGTDIVLSDIKLNQNLKSSKFTAKALTDD